MTRQKSRQDRFCQWCGKRLPKHRKSYCDNKCQGKGYSRDSGKVGCGPVPPSPWKPKARKIILSDEQQREIDRAVAAKHNLKLSSRLIKPGDADFEEVAAQCTPPERIPNRYYSDMQVVNLYGMAGGAL